MKNVNLGTYVFILIAALFMNWFVFDRFPWVSLPVDHFRELLEQYKSHGGEGFTSYYVISACKEDIISALRAYEYIQHLLAYSISFGLALAIIYYGEKQIFNIRAKTNWKIVVLIWIIPVLCISSSLGANSDDWSIFLLFNSAAATLLMWAYSFFYHMSRAKQTAARQPVQPQ